MKKFLKILGIVLGAILVIIIATGMWVNFSPLPTHPTQTIELSVKPDSNSLARGAKIVKHICATCHLGEDGKLSGQQMADADSEFGAFWSGNITKHPTIGTGRYSDGELAYLIRTGIKRDGHFAGPYMTRVNLSDEDLASIIQFLRSDDPLVAASNHQPPAPQYTFLVKALMKFGAFAPEEYTGEKINTPSAENTVEFGRYLVTEVYECYSCHSANFATNNLREPEQSAGYLTGGNLVELHKYGAVVSPNITMDKEHGIGKYSEAQFARIVRQGIRPDETQTTALMPKFSSLSDSEIHAIWEYIKTLPLAEKEQLLTDN